MKLCSLIAPLLFCLTLCVAFAARGDNILLAEFGLVSPLPPDNSQPAYTLAISSITGPEADWRLTTTDYDQTLHADAELLADFQRALAGGAYSLVYQIVHSYGGDIGQLFGVQFEVVVDGPERNGWFGTRHAPALGPGLSGYQLTDVERILTPDSQTVRIYGDVATVPPLPADNNGDGSVDAADYVVWRNYVGLHSGYLLWRENFGRTRGAVATAAPEPPGALLVLLLASHFLALRCSRPAA